MSTVILIAGPTASGKSALALELAAKLRGVIINADSIQVYRDLRIITARPTPDEEKRISHRLYGHVDAAENYSVGRWFGEAAAALADTLGRGQPAIMAGGTGLYFSTLTRGIAAAVRHKSCLAILDHSGIRPIARLLKLRLFRIGRFEINE